MRFPIYALATWRLAHLLASERGPYDVLGKLRLVCGVRYEADGTAIAETEPAKLITCVWCSSPWLAAGLWLLRRAWPGLGDLIVSALAASAVAVMVEENWIGTVK